MCGRFSVTPSKKELLERFQIEDQDKQLEIEFDPIYNGAPSDNFLALTTLKPKSFSLLKWGLIPQWSKDKSIAYKMINARAETINQKPTFKKLFKEKRCIIPADSFFEWDKKHQSKQPFRVLLKDHSIFSFAALFDCWQSADKSETINSFAIITTEANSLIGSIHNRMPVILTPESEKIWLNPESSEAELFKILVPFPDQALDIYPVSKALNTPKNSSADLLEPVSLDK